MPSRTSWELISAHVQIILNMQLYRTIKEHTGSYRTIKDFVGQ